MKKLLPLLILLNLADTLFAQTSLRNLILNSDYIIVLGDSSYTEEKLPNDSQIHQSGFLDTAGCEFIKGNIAESKIKIEKDFYASYPHLYGYDHDVLVFFIKRISDSYFLIDDQWMSPATLTNFKQLYAELSVINQSTDEKSRFEKTIDWILSLLEKSDGNVYEHDLDSTSLFIKYYKQQGVIKDGAYLNEDQKVRIKNYIFSESTSYAKLRLLDLIYPDFKQEIDDKLFWYIRTLNPKEDNYLMQLCMQKLLNDNDPEALKEMVQEFYDADLKKKKKIIRLFLRRMDHE